MLLDDDKQLHMAFSAILVPCIAYFTGCLPAVILVLLVGISKETLWDAYLGKGTPDIMDFVADCVGVVIGVVVWALVALLLAL